MNRKLLVAAAILAAAAAMLIGRAATPAYATSCSFSGISIYRLLPGNPGELLTFPTIGCDSNWRVVACPFNSIDNGQSWNRVGNCANLPPGCGSGTYYNAGANRGLIIDWDSSSSGSCASWENSNPTVAHNQIASPDGFSVACGTGYKVRFRVWNPALTTMYAEKWTPSATC